MQRPLGVEQLCSESMGRSDEPSRVDPKDRPCYDPSHDGMQMDNGEGAAMTFGLCGKIVATPGDGETLAGHLLDAAHALQDVEDCQMYLVNRVPDEPDAVWVVEVWDSGEAHQASLQLPAVQELIARARPIIAEMGMRIEMQPLGGKGLPGSANGATTAQQE
jgi:quinol monooxygenase YgiN